MKKLLYKKPSELKPYLKNPRENKEAVNEIIKSIETFGFQTPLLCDENFLIIAGDTRLKAAIKLKLDKIPVVITDEMDEKNKKAYRIIDNKLGEIADWNYDLLKDEFKELNIDDFNLELTGFSVSEIEDMMTPLEYKDEKEIDENIETEKECPKCGYKWS